jgi:hypothetical protein
VDRKLFLALTTLASAAGASPAFAAEMKRAAAGGTAPLLSGEPLLRTIYGVSISRNGAAVGRKALAHLGRSPDEAAQITDLTRSIAMKAGSYDAFRTIAMRGTVPKGVTLTAREAAMLRSIRARVPNGAMMSWDGDRGRTWEGSDTMSVGPKGNTWEGSSDTMKASSAKY